MGGGPEATLKRAGIGAVFSLTSASSPQWEVVTSAGEFSAARRMVVVEDADAIREPVVAAFADAGYLAYGASSGEGMEELVEGRRPDLVILDVMLPGDRDGFDLIDVVRTRSDAGIIMLTARDHIDDRLRGLHGGADDYVVKPFRLEELLARADAVLRRRGGRAAAITAATSSSTRTGRRSHGGTPCWT